MRADALSTAAFVLGLEEARELILSLDDVEAILVTEDKEVWLSPGLRERFELAAEDYELAS